MEMQPSILIHDPPTTEETLSFIQVTNVAATGNSFQGSSTSSTSFDMALETGAPVKTSDRGYVPIAPSDDEDPAVIVGIGCRLPGDIRSPSKLWDVLARKQSTQGPVPPLRFNMKGFYHPDNSRMGTMNANKGYFLQEDVRQFENSFFGINNLEAISMDPQQRKLLEVVHECLEDYGTPDISGTNTAVYVGNFTIDFQTMQTRDPDYIHRYSATGSGTAMMANRISHIFNLHGPSFTLDTACSSSMYGLHNAVVALKNGDCDGAIIAGANLITGLEQHLGTVKGGAISPTSTCHTFDVSADGYGRAEAVNAIYIKRLSSALKDGDNIRAVIRGTAINASGRTPGITQPSSDFQEVVIRKAYATAGLRFADTDYVECHGTGTAVGDPVEVDAVARCFSLRDGPPLMIGSVKTNLGHSEAASGLTSVIKVVLAFEKGVIPPTQGIQKLNPKLKLESRNLKVVTELEDWPRALRRAGINSFGFGGANAHAILESVDSYLLGYKARNQEDKAEGNRSERSLVLPLSAASANSLEARHTQISHYLEKYVDRNKIDELAFTLAHRRRHLDTRGFMLVRSGEQGVRLDPEQSGLITSTDTGGGKLPISFVFTGQGSQYAEMAKELLYQSPAFIEMIRRLDGCLQALPRAPKWTLEQTVLDTPDVSHINHVTRSQPICTAIQVALVEILRTWGVRPLYTVGHSSGEIAAAYAAGFLTAEQAILVAYFRGYAVGRLRSNGCMMAAALTVETAQELILQKGLKGEVCVACVNSPESITLSGSNEGIDILYRHLQDQKTFSRKIETGGRAYHSFMMKETGPLYESLLTPHLLENTANDTNHEPMTFRATMYSSVGTSDENLRVFDNSKELTTAAYWRENLENPVQFSSAMVNLAAAAGGQTHLIEIGPHTTLKGPIDQIRTKLKLSRQQLPYSPTLRRKEDADRCMKLLAGTLFNFGNVINFSAVNNSTGDLKPVHDLPPYPWNYTTGLLWAEPRASIELRDRKYLRHELLGSAQLANDGIVYRWRNILQLDEVPWIRDHKLESQIVFPATGYLGMAMEALSQARGLEPGVAAQNAMYEFRNVNIMTAFVVTEKRETGATCPTELHTTLAQQKLSTATASADWYDFSISSWSSREATQHCVGSIRLDLHDDPDTAMESSPTVTVTNTDNYEHWAMTKWYANLDKEGLCFGPMLQTLSSMQTDGNKIRPDAISTTRLIQRCGKSKEDRYPGTYYAVHPLTIDACVQAAIMGGTGGNLMALRAHLPVFITKCRIRTPDPETVGCDSTIHSRSRTTGPATKQIDSTLRDREGRAVVCMEEVRLSLYSGKAAILETSDGAGTTQRHPCLRVRWKPDILRLFADSGACLSRYIENATATLELDGKKVNAIVASLLDLVGHKNPRMRVLELGEEGGHAEGYLELLGKGTAFPRCRSWSRGEFDLDGKLSTDNETNGPFQVIVISGVSASERYGRRIKDLTDVIENQGVIICSKSDVALESLAATGFTVIDTGNESLIAIRPGDYVSKLRGREAMILLHDSSSEVRAFAIFLVEYLQSKIGMSRVIISALTSLSSPLQYTDKLVCISLLEIETPFIATMTQEEMDFLRCITEVVTDIVWLTGSNMLGTNSNPDTTLASGLSRALMLEKPSLRFSVLDIGKYLFVTGSDTGKQAICANICRALVPQHNKDDKEFVQHDGLLYVSRFGADAELNMIFSSRLESVRRQNSNTTVKLCDAAPAKLAVGKVGLMDTLHFEEVREPPSRPPPGFVDIAVKAVGINAKDVYSLAGRVETSNSATAHEFGGVVEVVGKGVENIAHGDRVLVMAPNYFGTTIRVPSWSVQKLLPGEDFAKMVTMPVAYITALYALLDRANLRAGETILIHVGAGAFGTAAIKVAQRIGAIVYTTVGSSTKRDFIVGLGVPESHIFQSRNASFAKGVKQATRGRGVDVIINSLVGDLMHDSWRCIAEFGRFVEVGKRELVDAGKLDMRIFLRNTTFTAFDISSLFFHEDAYYRNILAKRFKEVLELYRSKQIEPLPLTVYDAANISQAYRYFSAQGRVGKVVVTMQNPNSQVPVKPSRYKTILDPTKVYLLVGCLGGLGRSLSHWMIARGARKFVFLGRSGCDKPSAKSLVLNMESRGADIIVKVIRGNVLNAADVTAAVEACQNIGAIGGVVQAAMGLHEALFQRMSNTAWHTGIQPKWAGTWNLHNALAVDGGDQKLDFFLLTSSVSGSVGTATESNYCAANCFLDAFARWRRQQGKPAVSIGLGMISEVGYLHENPEIEALLLRKGIQPLSEDEFLQVVDLGITEDIQFAANVHGSVGQPDAGEWFSKGVAAAHILTGFEPFRLRELMSRGFEVDNGTLHDPRALILAAALTADQELGDAAQVNSLPGGGVVSTPWLKPLSTTVVSSLLTEADAGSLQEAVLRLVRKRFSSLVLIRLDQIDNRKALAHFGMDSMIAADFRTWFWNTFKVDIPFLDLLSPVKNLEDLAAAVEGKLTAG
ncbi:putative polyketide synthase [Biscogniauxia marginata]|nr:putative polyketide synthase [Biscogniauxia marginata]